MTIMGVLCNCFQNLLCLCGFPVIIQKEWLLALNWHRYFSIKRILMLSHKPTFSDRTIQRMRSLAIILLVFLITLTLTGLAGDTVNPPPKDLQAFLRQVTENEKRNRLAALSYIYEETETITQFGDRGEVKKVESKTYEVFPDEEEGYRRLIRRDGKPLPESEEKKEQKKLDENIAKNQSDRAKGKLDRKKAEREKKEKEIWDEVLNAYDIREIGRESHEGKEWMAVDFSPKPGYRARKKEFELMRKIQGRVWIDTTDQQITRLKVTLIEDFSVGAGFLAKIQKGGEILFQQRKINDEVWLPAAADIHIGGKLLLLKKLNFQIHSDYANYRKYETEVKISPLS
jgi:hypothetical protein